MLFVINDVLNYEYRILILVPKLQLGNVPVPEAPASSFFGSTPSTLKRTVTFQQMEHRPVNSNKIGGDTQNKRG